MTSSTYTRAKLIEMLTHVQYELDMLVETSIALGTGHEWVIQNALVESFVIHARALREFFFMKVKYDRHDPRNRVAAADYVPLWDDTRDDSPKILNELRIKANDRVAHLLIDRLNADPASTYWEIREIRDALLAVATRWAADAKREGFDIVIPGVTPVMGTTKVKAESSVSTTASSKAQ